MVKCYVTYVSTESSYICAFLLDATKFSKQENYKTLHARTLVSSVHRTFPCNKVCRNWV